VDYSRRTMQVALNSDEAYQGGRLVFATGQNGFVVPRRPAGSATVHCGNLAHGVTALVSGVRYGLFFCDTPPPLDNKPRTRTVAASPLSSPLLAPLPAPPLAKPKSWQGLSFAYLAEAALAEFAFFERALTYLKDASDDDLVLAAAAYARFFSALAYVRWRSVALASAKLSCARWRKVALASPAAVIMCPSSWS